MNMDPFALIILAATLSLATFTLGFLFCIMLLLRRGNGVYLLLVRGTREHTTDEIT